MNLIVIGLNHRSAPVEVRERLAFPKSQMGEATCQLLGAAALHEAAIVSTCNRVEIYAVAGDVPEASAGMRKFIHEYHRLANSVDPHLYEFSNKECVTHLLEVTCGLDSMVLGETEILGQVKDAYEAAQQAGATGPVLNRMFQKTFSATKNIRTNTAITRGSTSVASVAVDLAGKIFRDLSKCTVMVIGTGTMSEATAKALHSRGAGQILVCSRSHERGMELAAQFKGRAIGYDDWPREFAGVDIVIGATTAPHPILTKEKLVPLLDGRESRPLFLIDIGVPRDMDRSCGDVEDVYLYDIDDLQQIAQQNVAAREREIATCREMIGHHAGNFLKWFEENRQRFAERHK
jgi:glutamyl-tRNA reductase